MQLSCRFVPPPTLTAYPKKHGLNVVMPIWQVLWVWHNVTLPLKTPSQALRSSMNNRCLMGLMSFAIFYPSFIFRSTSVNGSMSTINNKSDKESCWNMPRLMTTWPSSTPPDVNTVFQFTMLLMLLLLLFLAAPTHRPSPGCSGSTNQAPYHVSHLIIYPSHW